MKDLKARFEAASAALFALEEELAPGGEQGAFPLEMRRRVYRLRIELGTVYSHAVSHASELAQRKPYVKDKVLAAAAVYEKLHGRRSNVVFFTPADELDLRTEAKEWKPVMGLGSDCGFTENCASIIQDYGPRAAFSTFFGHHAYWGCDAFAVERVEPYEVQEEG